MLIRPIRSNELLTALGVIVAALLLFIQPACDKNNTPSSPDNGDTLIILPLVPYEPQPADGAIDVGDEFTCTWQCYNPDSLSLEYHVYMGIDSMDNIVGRDWSDSLTIPWGMQIRAKEILVQVYRMQMAYHAQNGSFCLDGRMAGRTYPDAFSLIGISIDSTDCYCYAICAAFNSFTCTAIANLDNDATIDTWRINQSGVLEQISSDFPDGLYPCEFHPATTYSWRVLVLYNADQDSVWGPIWHFTTTSDIIPPEYEVGLPRFPLPDDYAVGVTCSTVFCWCCIKPDDDSLTYDLYLAPGDIEPQLHNRNMTLSQAYLDWGKQWKVQQKLLQIYDGEQYFKYYRYDSCYVLNGISACYGHNYFHLIGVDMEINDVYNYTISASCDTFVCVAVANIDADPTIDTWTIDQTGIIRHVTDDSNMPFTPGQLYSWKIVAHDTQGNSYEGPIWHFTTSSTEANIR
jgi:hypothetical protein